MTGLVFCLADSDVYKLPMFSPSEIFLSPDVTQPQRDKVYRIPRGSPHIESLYRLYPELPLKPDYVFIKTDALAQNFVRGVSTLGCPSFISIADTHHLHRPIETIINYLSNEQFTLISAENDRHHLKWYLRAGFENLSWHPNIALNPDIYEPVLFEETIRRVCFVGSLGRFHPYRRYIVQNLSETFADFDYGQMPQSEASRTYNKYLISLNISLNSDLNWRFFEILAAGGFLLTDRLPESAGISHFLKEGVHYQAFSSFEELKYKVNYYLKNPIEAKLIAKQGHIQYLKTLQPKVLKKRMLAELFGLHLSDKPTNKTLELPLTKSLISIRAYQSLQELHRLNVFTNVYIQNCSDRFFLLQNELADFTRITLIELDNSTEPQALPGVRSIDIKNQDNVSRVIYFDSSTNVNDLLYMITRIKPMYIVPDDYPVPAHYDSLIKEQDYRYSDCIDCYEFTN